MFFPAKAIEIDALIQRLDYEGVDAVLTGVIEHFRKAEPETGREDIKN